MAQTRPKTLPSPSSHATGVVNPPQSPDIQTHYKPYCDSAPAFGPLVVVVTRTKVASYTETEKSSRRVTTRRVRFSYRMTTFRLGSSCSPAKSTSISVPCREEEDDVEDAADPDRLLQCPYDKNHQIRACRFPYHLIKCSKNHPKLAQELKTCPFNARHLMPKHELSHHIANCVDRSSVNTEDLGSNEVQSKWHVPVNTWENPKCNEDWDKELEDIPAVPFIWGVNTTELNQESFRAETRTTNNLPGVRAPTTLPWKN
ncbi:hypothetical protein SKAU_G00099360 [Synaphobranchus kaupii]|uniref:CHHC U11-48K-type domain-containing protein n=1 Tax=Synaphobranchus kaupii TaxID=118154 RepID=A0A9Q1FY27_SYNKA|nr:hypothetical protein SKAU_G00099360 [Synaphobranchus kaupii]